MINKAIEKKKRKERGKINKVGEKEKSKSWVDLEVLCFHKKKKEE